MTFEWPIALAGLVLLPLALGLWLLARRRQGRYAVRFSNLDVLAEVAHATRSPWRFVPPALLCAALAAMAIGLARPQISVSAERRQGTVVLALDRSGSMLAEDVDPDRITASREAALRFVKGLPDTFSVGVVTFSDTADAASAPSLDRTGAERAISRLKAGGGTAIGDAIERSLGLLGVTSTTPPGSARDARSSCSPTARTRRASPRPRRRRSPSAPACPCTRSRSARPTAMLDLGSLGIGTGTIPVPPDPDALKQVADDTGGEAFTALDESTLKKVYDRIGTRVSSTKQQKEVTFVVAGAAAALLLAAAASSWATRITS